MECMLSRMLHTLPGDWRYCCAPAVESSLTNTRTHCPTKSLKVLSTWHSRRSMAQHQVKQNGNWRHQQHFRQHQHPARVGRGSTGRRQQRAPCSLHGALQAGPAACAHLQAEGPLGRRAGDRRQAGVCVVAARRAALEQEESAAERPGGGDLAIGVYGPCAGIHV